MITVDWGDPDETLIVLRIQDNWHLNDFERAIQHIKTMLAQAPKLIDLMIDIRAADPIQAHIVRAVDHHIAHRSLKLQRIIAVTTPAQACTIQLLANFYPMIASEIVVVESVDQAYQLVLDVA
ncbi:MAG: hypothetical protein WBC91_09735 [Phototrophicaceae bacterium]